MLQMPSSSSELYSSANRFGIREPAHKLIYLSTAPQLDHGRGVLPSPVLRLSFEWTLANV